MRRKLLLATSFVLTLACNREADKEPIHANPPRPDPDPTATTATTTDPTTSATTDPETDVSIQKMPDGKCVRVVHVKCPEGVMCNPPPPKEVPCPDAH